MGSRIRQNPEKVFELFAEVARPEDVDNQEPFLLQTYPPECSEELRKSVPKFAFPCNFENPAVDHFTFVFTDIDGNYTFGFCRHTAGAHTCLCIISFLPWYEVFYKLLNKIAEILNKSEDSNPNFLLKAMYELTMPEPGTDVSAITADYNNEFSFVCPDLSQLPSIPENRNLTEYYNAVDAHNMMVIFASMLTERRILITSKKLSRMTACVHGCAALIYPMFWQHLYIPVLPGSLIDYVTAPMPFLIGIHSTLLEKARRMELGDVVILDADKNTVETEYDDLGTLPSDIVSSLKKKLRQQQTDKVHTTMMRGDGVARAFLRTLVNLIGGYRDALKFREGESILFDEDAFINSRPSSVRPFLEKMLHLQIFHQFIEERLDLLNTGEGFSDLFEEETTLMADKGSSSKYKEWMGSMKKHGKKFRREGKDIISGLTSRANPVIRSTFDTVKDKSKKAMKELKSRIDDLRKDDDNGPATLPSAPLKTERPPRPPLPGQRAVTMRSHGGSRRRTSYEKARHYKPIEFDDVQGVISDDDDFKHSSVGLLDDPDIQNALRKSWSCEDILNTHDSDEDVLIQNSSESLSTGVPLPAPRMSIRKNVSDTALEELQYQYQAAGTNPVAPPRRRHTKKDDAPLITLSAIAPDISDSDSEHSDIGQTNPMFGYEPITNVVDNNVTDENAMGKVPTQLDNKDMDTIERNKVSHLSKMFQQDITKHIIEQETGKIYEPAYRDTEAKPKISRHEAFRDSAHRPVPSKRSLKTRKTDEIIQQLTGHHNPSEVDTQTEGVTRPVEDKFTAKHSEDLFDPLSVSTKQVENKREVACFEDVFVPTHPSVSDSELAPEEKEKPQLSPNTDLLKDWDLNFDLASVHSKNQVAPVDKGVSIGVTSSHLGQTPAVHACTIPVERSASPNPGNSMKIHVRGPYGSAGYAASPRFYGVSSYANQSNYVSSPVLQPPSSVSMNKPTVLNKPPNAVGIASQNSTSSWSDKRSSPNYSAIHSTDFMTSSVFPGADKASDSTIPGLHFPSSQATQRNVMYSMPKPFSEPVLNTRLYNTSEPGSTASLGQVGSQTSSNILKPQLNTGLYSNREPGSTGSLGQSSSGILRPQSSSTNVESDPFADLDPLKSMASKSSAPKWETFE